MVFNLKIAVLTALNWKNNAFNGVEPEKKSSLTTLKRKINGVYGIEPEKQRL